jgi:hypothetical protein
MLASLLGEYITTIGLEYVSVRVDALSSFPDLAKTFAMIWLDLA